MPVKFERIQIDLDRVILQGETDSSKQIDTLTTALKSHRCFKEVKQGKVEKTRDGRRSPSAWTSRCSAPSSPARRPKP